MKTHTLPVQVNRGAGDALVLLHGLGTNYKSWTYVLNALDSQKQQVIIFDLLGFGDAPKPKQHQYTYEDHADAVIAALDKLGIQQAVIAGHSMGCIVAIEVAKKRPDLTKQLVLLGAPLYRRLPRGSLWEKLQRIESAYFTIFSIIAKNPDMTIGAAKSLDTLAPFLKGMEITEATWPAFVASLRNTIMQTQPFKDAVGLTTPTILVYGKLDFFVIKRSLKRVARRNKQYMTFQTMLGPHEITPLQGKRIARLLRGLLNTS